MTNYQKRMTRFVSVVFIYSFGCPIAFAHYEIGGLAWVIYASTLTLYYGLAVGLDAVYDSLREQQPGRQYPEDMD